MTEQSLTVVVPTRDRPELLDRCLGALHGELRPDDQVIVVDSAPAAVPAGPVAARWGAQCVSLSVAGASRARNAGWRAATTGRVSFIDDDVLVTPGWRNSIATPEAGFVLGSVAEHPEDTPAEHPLALVTSATGEVVNRTGPLLPGGSGNLLTSREALEAIGGFDEQLGPGTWFASAEDLDLVDRLVAAGYTGWYEPSAVAWHVQWRAAPENLRTHWAYGKGMGARLSRLARTDRVRARALLPRVARLGGLRTATDEVRTGQRRSWGPPIAWRLGAAVGLVAGFARLPAQPRR